MELILMRHGKTPKLDEAGVATDSERPLGELGRAQAKAAGKALAKMDLLPTLVLASPIARARETAEAAVKAMGGKVKLQVHPPLSTSGEAEPLRTSLLNFGGEARLMLVGHQPTLGELASLFVEGSTSGLFEIKPGGMLLIELDSAAGSGVLRWLLTPRQIEALA